ncbi:MAG TPA: ATP-dependent DNA helicase RecQ [Edaphocola sp.]|nr:ATP-dependent DNA helicase RecQ [Edaphocola sp.]
MEHSALEILKKYWGYDSFRPLQKEIIFSILNGEDTFAVLPTGAGKSICYQVPALDFEGLTIVISPLIALMEDQVRQLQHRNISACCLHSGMDSSLYEENLSLLENQAIKILYVAPERLLQEHFIETIQNLTLSLIAVDEAHCISEWGHDFRPAYRKIADFTNLFPRVPILALTASATASVRKDILEQLNFLNAKVFEQSIRRDNLSYHVIYSENKITLLEKYLSNLKSGSAIIYCGSRRRTIELAIELEQRLGKKIFAYHAGLHRQEKKFAYEQWQQQDGSIITATSAFGMGIDKPDVRMVFHYDLPVNIEQYYQEVGRAGRDEAPAKGILLYNQGDLHKLSLLPQIQYPPIPYIRNIYPMLMDFLNIGIGEGKDWTKAFNVVKFTNTFKLDLLPTISALKILEQESYWIWNEDARTKYTVGLTTNRTQIEILEQSHPQLYEVIEILLRHYGSIYHFETPIQIFEMSKLLNIDKTIFEERLFRLETLGILRYHPAIIGSHIYFLENRIAGNYLSLNEQHILLREKNYTDKILAFKNYIEQKDCCRNKLLSSYFGEPIPDVDCGHCDYCQNKNLDSNKETILRDIILVIQSNGSISINELLSKFSQYPSKLVISLIQTLIEEQKIFLKDDIIQV